MQQSTSAPPNKPRTLLTIDAQGSSTMQIPPERQRSPENEMLLLQIETALCLSYFLEVEAKNPKAYKLITLAQMQDQQTEEYIADLYSQMFNRTAQ